MSEQHIPVSTFEFLAALEFAAESGNPHLAISGVLAAEATTVVDVEVAEFKEGVTQTHCSRTGEAEDEEFHGNFALACPAVD